MPQQTIGNETGKIFEQIKPFLIGRGIDIGCGDFPLNHPALDTVDRSQSCNPTMCCSAVKIPVEKERYDFVYSSHVLEHIWFPEKALIEWLRILKPGGFLILHLPHRYFYPNISDGTGNADHKHDLVPEDVITMLNKIGWSYLIQVTTLAEEVLVRYRETIPYRGPKCENQYSFIIIAEKKNKKKIEKWIISGWINRYFKIRNSVSFHIKKLIESVIK